MLGIDSFSILETVLKGMMVGIIVSAPMGPVGMLVVRRTLMKGRNYGFATGLGAAFSDIFYAVITGIGLGYVLSFIHDEKSQFVLRIVGSALLFLFGFFAYRTKVKEAHAPSNKKGNLMQNCATGFLLAVSNPLIIFMFMALMARFDFVSGTDWHVELLGYAAVFFGAALWWSLLTTTLKNSVQRFGINIVYAFNRILGIIVMVVAVLTLIYTLLK